MSRLEPVRHTQESVTVASPRGELEAILMLASQSGKRVCSAFVLAAGVHLSSEMGF